MSWFAIGIREPDMFAILSHLHSAPRNQESEFHLNPIGRLEGDACLKVVHSSYIYQPCSVRLRNHFSSSVL